MEKSKLILLFKTLSTSEVKEFGKFLEGASYRKSGGVFLLYSYLKKWHPSFPSKKMEKETVSKAVFKNNKAFNRRLFDVMSNLYKALEDFLIKKRLEEKEIERDFLLLEVLKERKLDKLFFLKINHIEKSWEKKEVAGIDHLHHQYRLMQMSFSHPNYSVINEMPIGPHTLIEKIDQYYIATKLYWTLCWYNTNNYFGNGNGNTEHQKEQYLIPEILELCQSEDFQKLPQIRLLSQLLKVFKGQDQQDYQQCQDEFFNHLGIYNSYEKHDIVTILSYWCYKNHKQGKTNALQELFELNQFAAQEKLILEDGYISDIIFRNIIHIACAVNEVDWAESFMQEYGCLLQEETRTDVLVLCEALIVFNRHQYGLALEKLAPAQFKDVAYGVQARCIQLQCYYELEDYQELFYNLCKSFMTFLNRRKDLADYTKETLKNFIIYTKKLHELTYGINEKENAEQLYQGIIHKDNIAYKAWLLKKIEKFITVKS